MSNWMVGVCRCAVAAAGSAILIAATGSAAWTGDGAAARLSELAARCRAAKEPFRPLAPADVESARAELRQALAELDAWLDRAGSQAEPWRRYLRRAETDEQLRRAEPDLDVLAEVFERYDAGHEGLDLAVFSRVRRALGRYLEITAAAGQAEAFRAARDEVLDELAQRLDAAARAESLSPDDARAIGSLVGWLDEMGQAEELVDGVRAAFDVPNLELTLAAELVVAGIAGPLDQREPVHDVILGTEIRGTGRMLGETKAELVPSDEAGVIDVLLFGRVAAETIGYNGPARIGSKSITRLAARKRLRIDANGISALGARSNAVTDSTIEWVGSARGGRLVERVACRSAWEQKPLAERISAQHAQRDLERRLDRQLAEQMREVNQRYERKLRRPLVERDLFPELCRWRTSAEALRLVARRSAKDQLSAMSPPPEPPAGAELVLCVHQSMVNNLAEGALSGMTVADERFERMLGEWFGETRERFRKSSDEPPWSVAFAREGPIELAIDDGGFRVEIRGRRYSRGNESYPGMNVAARYRFVLDDEGLKAVRQGGLDVAPPGFGADDRLSPRQITIKTLLERRFGKILEEEIRVEDIKLPGNWEKLGPLRPIGFTSQGGWLVIGWRRRS